jgi:hypothetical protein
MEATSQATSQYVSLAQEYIGGAKKSAVDKGYVSKTTAEKLPGAPVEKDYTSSPAKDTTTAPTEKSSSPITSDEKPATSHSGPDFPVAPVDNISSSAQPTPVVGNTDFPAAPKDEPHGLSHEVPAAHDGADELPAAPAAAPAASADSDEAPALSTEEHGIEEKKQPIPAI